MAWTTERVQICSSMSDGNRASRRHPSQECVFEGRPAAKAGSERVRGGLYTGGLFARERPKALVGALKVGCVAVKIQVS